MRALGIRPPPPTTVIIAWRLYSAVASISIFQPCGLPNCLEQLSKPSLPQDLGPPYNTLFALQKSSISLPAPRRKHSAACPLGFPDVDKSEQVDDPPPSASPVETPRGHGDETRSFSRLPCHRYAGSAGKCPHCTGSDEALQLR